MPESTAPERLIRRTTSIAQLLATRVQDTPDREAYRYPVGDEWRSMTWKQTYERVKAIAAGLLAPGVARRDRVRLLANHRLDLRVCAQPGQNFRLRGLTLYCDGWAHDYAWLGVLFEAAGMTPTFKLDNLRALLTDKEAAFWNVVKKQITTEMRLQRHRASSDAKILQRTLMRLRQPLTPRPRGDDTA